MNAPLERRPRRWVPPAAAARLDACRKCIGLSGAYRSWDQASGKASSYDKGSILERVLQASRQVRDGRAAYENDSVLFDRVEHSFPLLATLQRAALEGDKPLSVVDFSSVLRNPYRESPSFLGDRVLPLRMDGLPFLVTGMTVKGSQRLGVLNMPHLSPMQRAHPSAFYKTSPACFEISYLKPLEGARPSERDPLLGICFALIQGQMGFASGLARRSQALYANGLFEATLHRVRSDARRGYPRLFKDTAVNAYRRMQ